MRDGAIERMNAASRGGKRSTPSNAARIPKLCKKRDVGLTAEKDVFEEHDSPHIGDRHGMADYRGARARKRFEEMLTPLAHLVDAAGTPPHTGLGVDEDRWACQVAIGNPLCCQAVDKAFGGRNAMRLALQEGENCGAACKFKRLSAGQSAYPGASETGSAHELLPTVVTMQTGQQGIRDIPPIR
jgi:hypothetical protein